eukprot:g5599.t1
MAAFAADIEWYYLNSESTQLGPFTLDELGDFYKSSSVTDSTLVWHENIKDAAWASVADVDGLQAALSAGGGDAEEDVAAARDPPALLEEQKGPAPPEPAPVPPPRPVTISGATGPNAAAVNGDYLPTGEIYNGKPLFRKSRDAGKWLRYVTHDGRNTWMVSPTADKEENKGAGWAWCDEKGLHDPADAGATWKVWDGTQSQKQAAVACVVTVRPVTISGATGPNAAAVNGTYLPTPEIYNGKPLFFKFRDPDKWLRYVTHDGRNTWMVSPTADKEENKGAGWAWCDEKGLHDPADAGATWNVWDGTQSQKQAAVACVVMVRPVTISGTTGPNAAAVNGDYLPTGDIYNGKPLFRKSGDPDKWLRYVTHDERNTWMVSPTADKEENKGAGWAYCNEKGLHDPADTGAGWLRGIAATSRDGWDVWDGTQFQKEAAVACVRS